MSIDSPGDNVLMIKNLSKNNSPVTLAVTSSGPKAKNSLATISAMDGQASGKNPVIISVADASLIPELTSLQKRMQEAQAPTPVETGAVIAIASSATAIMIALGLWLGRLATSAGGAALVSSARSYLEPVRQLGFQAYSKATPPKLKRNI